jgi:hypothetical protein
VVVLFGHGESVCMDVVAWVRWRGNQQSVDKVYPRVESAIVDHVLQLVFDTEARCGELGRHLIQRDAAEWDEVLDDALGADAAVYGAEHLGHVHIEEVVIAVALQHLETGAVLGVAEEIDGAADVRLELEEVAEFAVGEDLALQVAAVHGGKRAEAAVDGYVIGRDDVLLPGNVCGRLGGEIYRRRLEKVRGSLAELADGHVREAVAGRDDGLQLRLVVALELGGLHLGEVRLYAQPRLLRNADVHQAESHVGEVLVRSAVFAHLHVGLLCAAVVAAVEVEVAEIFVAHLGMSAVCFACSLDMGAHPYALLDQVVLVRLELVLQPVLLLLCLARLLLCPGRVEQRGGILGRDGAELIDQRRVQLDVLALLGLRNGEAVGVDGEVRRVRANVVEAVSAGEAWVGLAEGCRTCFWGTRQHSCQCRSPGRTWVHLQDLAELSRGVCSQDGQAIVPVTMVAPLARIC